MRRILPLLSFVILAGCIHLAAEIATNRFPRVTNANAPKTPSVAEQNAAFCARNSCEGPAPRPVDALLDLHAHISMKPGMDFAFSGVPWELEKEPVWSDRFSEKMAVERVRASGLKLIVVSLYANVFAIWPKDMYTAIYEEIAQTEELVKRHPDLFAIATTSEQARRIIASGKIALVYSLEGAEWVMRSPEDVAALYRAGVRMVNPIHLYDSWIGGADLQGDGRAILNPPGYGHSHHVAGRRENRLGLLPEGKNLLRMYADYGIIIDISHFSRQSLRDLDAMPELKGLPVVNSHMPNLIDTADNERAVDAYAFKLMSERHGLLGLVPSSAHPVNLNPYPDLCHGTVETFARTYALAVERGGGMPIAFASDFNGGIGHLKPTHGPDGCYPIEQAQTGFQREGLAHAGYIPDMMAGMQAMHADPSPMYAAGERFLQILETVERRKVR